MGAAWARMGIVRRLAISVVIVGIAGGTAWLAFRGDWAGALRGAIALSIVVWAVAPLGSIQERTTGRLSVAQTLASGLAIAIGYGVYRVVVQGERPFVLGAVILVGLALLVRVLVVQGWSHPRSEAG